MCVSDCVILCVCVHVCHCLQKSEESFQVGGENVILQGAERELPASFTYILIFPRGKGGKEDSAAAAKILLFFFFCNIYIQNMPVQIIVTWLRLGMSVILIHLSSIESIQLVANVHLKTQKFRGMALHLNKPTFYRPTLKPKRKNAASTYSHCSLSGWLTSKDVSQRKP